MFDPLGFLHLALGRAHDEVASSATASPRHAAARDQRGLPGAGRRAYWAHVGDSRVYHLRHGKVSTRTRDHSHVELLLREGKITEDECRLTRCAISSSAASAAIPRFPR